MGGNLLLAASLAGLLAQAGCASSTGTPTGTGTGAAPAPTAASQPAASQPAASPEAAVSPAEKVLVRFTPGETTVDVMITPDNPTAKDFLSLLPLTLTLEEFAGKEKLGRLPRDLETAGSPGSDPEDGDLIYFIPWGNLGFYYNADGIGYWDQTIHLGTYTATAEQLARLEGGNVTAQIVK